MKRKPRTIYQRKRMDAHISQEKAAEALDMSVRNLQFIEAGKRELKLKMGFAMADLYGCDIQEFRVEMEKKKEGEEALV